MIVEFSGPSGAGKTTLIESLLQKNAFKGNVIAINTKQVSAANIPLFILHPSSHGLKTDLYLLPWCVFFIVKHFLFFSFCFRKALSVKGHRIVMLRSLWRKAGLYQFFRKRALKGYVILWDEGLIHFLHNAFISTDSVADTHEIKKFVELVPSFDFLVIVNDDFESLISKLKQRGAWPRGIEDEGRLRAFSANSSGLFQSLCELIHLNNKVYVYETQNDDIDRLVTQITESRE